MLRRLIGLAAIAGAASAVAAPASAVHVCAPAEYSTIQIGVCAGQWCTDVCRPFAVAYCREDLDICDTLEGAGLPPYATP